MIFKLILLAAVVYMVYVLFFREGNLLEKVKEQKEKMSRKKGAEDDVETVVECHTCGVFVSVEEAILKDGRYYCSKKCAGVK